MALDLLPIFMDLFTILMLAGGYYAVRKFVEKLREFEQEKPNPDLQYPPVYEPVDEQEPIDVAPRTLSTGAPAEEGVPAFGRYEPVPLRSRIKDLHHEQLEIEDLEDSDAVTCSEVPDFSLQDSDRIESLRRAVVMKEVLERKF